MDFTFGSADRLGRVKDDSLYGGNVVGRQITGGVDLAPSSGKGPGGFYDLQSGYSSPSGSVQIQADKDVFSGGADTGTDSDAGIVGHVDKLRQADMSDRAKTAAILHDPDLIAMLKASATAEAVVLEVAVADLDLCPDGDLDADNLSSLSLTTAEAGDIVAGSTTVRRLTRPKPGALDADGRPTHILVTNVATTQGTGLDKGDQLDKDADIVFAVSDGFGPGGGLGSVRPTDSWPLEEPSPGTGIRASAKKKDTIPEIDIKVDSVAVTAQTKKLKAKWTPELGQDLNAYHNLDAEVELTGILSEQIALEIDQEILSELIDGATAGTLHWSRRPGQFLDREAGTSVTSNAAPPDFTGTVSEWYETLIETINDVSAQIHRKTLRGGATHVVCSPEVANILEFTSGFRASATHDDEKGSIGAVKAGSLSRKWDVYVDPYFPRQVILVGRKGSSFLESGFVYAPYVPLQVTPTIFGTEDFVPRKGVMTRYAKKMVRPDLYGLVLVHDLVG